MKIKKVTVAGVRHYEHPDTGMTYPSVTTIINAGGVSRAMVNWASKTAAEYAVSHWEELGDVDDTERVKLIGGSPFRQATRAADTGTNAHQYAEEVLLGKRKLTEKLGAANSILMGGEDHAAANVRALLSSLDDVEALAVECVVFNETYGYAGTFDALLYINGRLYLVDWKSNKRAYPDMALQLAAYRYAEQVLIGDKLVPMPVVEDTLIFHIPKEGRHRIYRIRTSGYEMNAFLAHLSMYAWQVEHEADVLKPANISSL